MSSFGWLFLKTAPLMAWNDGEKTNPLGARVFWRTNILASLGSQNGNKKWRIWENPNIPLEHTPRHPQPPHDDFFFINCWFWMFGVCSTDLLDFFSREPLLSLQVTFETPQSTQRGLLDIGRQKPFRWVFHLFWRLRTCLSLCESTHPSYSSLRMKRAWNPPVCLSIWSYERMTYEKTYFFPVRVALGEPPAQCG